MRILGDIQFTLLSWIESIWQLCVENVEEELEDDDFWKQGNHLLTYIANVARHLLNRYFPLYYTLLMKFILRTQINGRLAFEKVHWSNHQTLHS